MASAQWNRSRIAAESQSIRSELEQIERRAGASACLAAILERIRQLEDDASAQGRLRRFLYVVSALLHHSAKGGLERGQIRKLSDLGYAILRTQGIEPAESTLAFLYSELHSASSQIYRREGAHWPAAWEQALAALTGAPEGGGRGAQRLALGIYAARLGHSRPAIASLTTAAHEKLPLPLISKARIEKIRALRLSGQLPLAERLSQDTQAEVGRSDADRRELTWQLLCCHAQRTGDITPLMAAVRRGGSHYEYRYVLEASFWARAVESKQWLERVPRLKSIGRNRRLRAETKNRFHQCASVLETCYLYHVPFERRLHAVGKMLPRLSGLPALDQELLVWAAVARWLTRSRAFLLATFVLGEYQGLSLKVTHGCSSDALGVLGDILTREWFQKNEAA